MLRVYEEEGKELTSVNANSPEFHHTNPERAEYVVKGYDDKEDYERNQRRGTDQKKG